MTEEFRWLLNKSNIDYEQKANPKGRFFVLKRRGKESFSFPGKLKPYLDNHGFCMIIRANPVFKPLADEYAKNIGAKIYYSMEGVY